MAQIVRWYVMPLEVRVNGKLVIPQTIRTLLQGRWTYYRLPGDRWALVRVRGEDTQQATLGAQPLVIPWPRRREGRWNTSAPERLKTRLDALGITVTGNPQPDEVLDQVGQAHQDYTGGYATPWNRQREKRSDEAVLGAVEEV